ncbi:MAG: hypothetical protein HQK97_07145, partial [Nitrospirae bacterium]|nr:hypothetical protein [Nitrospirota bacterium]
DGGNSSGSGAVSGGPIVVSTGASGTVTTGNSNASSTGSHYQAQDCLLCHNTQQQSSSNLIIGGTMYNASSVSNVNDLNNCYVDNLNTASPTIVRIQFLDNNTNVAADSIYYMDTSSRGYNAKGNLFILGRMMTNLLGSYYIRLLDSTGTQIARSNRMHRFLQIYNSAYPNDPNNMYSCNACHMSVPSSGAPGLIYPNMRHNQGKDCLQCHNADPTSSKALAAGGTLFLTATDTNNVCASYLRLQLTDDNNTPVYDTANFMNAGISGSYGKGNFSIMSLSLPSLKGSYFMNILTPEGTVVASSTLKHDFTTAYNTGTPADLSNRYSCNACHSANPQNDAPGLLYPNINSWKCL